MTQPATPRKTATVMETFEQANARIEREMRAEAIEDAPALRYTVAARGAYWSVMDDDAVGAHLPSVYETFCTRASAEACADRLNRLQRDNTSSSREIADAIDRNCNSFHMTEIDRATWDAEQNRLWALAAALGCASDVIRLVAPSLRGAK